MKGVGQEYCVGDVGGGVERLWKWKLGTHTHTHTHTLSQEMQDNYAFLLRVYDRVVERLCEGVRLCDVYTAALQLVETERPDLKDHFTRNVGYVRCHAPFSVRVLGLLLVWSTCTCSPNGNLSLSVENSCTVYLHTCTDCTCIFPEGKGRFTALFTYMYTIYDASLLHVIKYLLCVSLPNVTFSEESLRCSESQEGCIFLLELCTVKSCTFSVYMYMYICIVHAY